MASYCIYPVNYVLLFIRPKLHLGAWLLPHRPNLPCVACLCDCLQDCTLAVIQATCMVLAAKVIDRPPSSSVLRDILQNLYHCSSVTADQAYEVEARCLEALGWRLGPYYSEDPLTDESRMCRAGR